MQFLPFGFSMDFRLVLFEAVFVGFPIFKTHISLNMPSCLCGILCHDGLPAGTEFLIAPAAGG
jgi:hypothetical protein